MNKTTILTLALVSAACDPTKTAKLKTAIADLNLPDELKPAACELYRQRGKELAESIWTHDWPVFAPMFSRPANPQTDYNFCHDVITVRGALILQKPPVNHASTAAYFAVALASDFHTWTIERQASILCHEAAHIVWQKRRGKLAALDYLTVSGRLVAEGTAYALTDALLERYGTPPEKIAKGQARRARRFPAAYKIEKTVDSECVAGYFGDIRAALRERAGH